jgi:uncharacterized repeat protein (TIGR01451 family)
MSNIRMNLGKDLQFLVIPSNVVSSEQRRLGRSFSFLKRALVCFSIIFLAFTQEVAAQSCSKPLVFKNPVLISGTANTQGARYRFNNYDPAIPSNYAELTISVVPAGLTVVSVDSFSATSGGYDDAWQPAIKSTNGTDSHIEWTWNFKNSTGGNTSVCFSVTTIDNDGYDATVEEYAGSSVGLNKWGSQMDSVITSSPTWKYGKSKLTTGPFEVLGMNYLNRGSAFEVNFTARNTFQWRTGLTGATPSGDCCRIFSMYFEPLLSLNPGAVAQSAPALQCGVSSFNPPSLGITPASTNASGVSGVRYQWAYSNTASTYTAATASQWVFMSSTSNTITSIPAISQTTYYVRLAAVIGGNGWQPSNVVAFYLPTNVTATIEAGPYCVGQSYQLTANSTTSLVNFAWTGPNGFSTSGATPTINSATVGSSGTYTVTASVAGGCSATATVAATFIPCNEICNNFIDDDGDSFIDEADPDSPCFDPGKTLACDDKLYMVRSASVATNTLIERLDILAGIPTLTTLFNKPLQLNALGQFNGFLYAMANNGTNLYRIDAYGAIVDLGVVAGLPIPDAQWSAGTIGRDGNFYIMEGKEAANHRLFKIPLLPGGVGNYVATQIMGPAAGEINLPNNPTDIAMDETGTLYAFSQGGTSSNVSNPAFLGGLFSINLTTGNATRVSTANTYLGASLGSLFITDEGKIYGYGIVGSTSGYPQQNFYVIDKATGAVTQAGTSSQTGVGRSDGASCPWRVTLKRYPSTTCFFPGVTFNWEYAVRNQSGQAWAGVELRDTLDSRFSYTFDVEAMKVTLRAIYGNSVTIQLGNFSGGTNNVLTILGLNIPNQISTSLSLQTTIATTATFAPPSEVILQQAWLKNVATTRGGNEPSDNPLTLGPFSDKTPVTVYITTSPVITAASSACLNNPISVRANNIPGVTYAWNYGSGATPATGSGIGPNNVSYSTVGTKTITLTVTSSTGCSASTTTTVTVGTGPSLTLGATPSVCRGTTTANLIYTSSFGSPNQYSINFDLTAEGQGFADVSNVTLGTSPIVITVPSGAAAGTYNATVVVNNTTAGCNGSPQAFQVTVVAAPSVTLSAIPSVCRGITSTTLPYSALSAGATQYSINFDATAEGQGFVDVVNANITSTPINIAVPANGLAGTYNATVTVTNPTTGCVSTVRNITVQIISAVVANAGADVNNCNGSTLTLAANTPAPGNGAWSIISPANGASLSSNTSPTARVNGLQSGRFVDLIWTITTGSCVSRDTVRVSNFITNSPACNCNNIYSISGSNANNYAGNQIRVLNTTTGTYTTQFGPDLGPDNVFGFGLDTVYKRFYYSDVSNGAVRYLDSYGNDVATGVTLPNVASFNRAGFNPVDKKMYFISNDALTWASYTPTASGTGGAVTTISTLNYLPASATPISATAGGGDIVFDAEGNGYVITNDGQFYKVVFSGTTANIIYLGRLNLPTPLLASLAFGSDNKLYLGGAGALNSAGTGFLGADVYSIDLQTLLTTKLNAALTSATVDFASCSFPFYNSIIVPTKTYVKYGSAGSTISNGDTLEYTIKVKNTGNISAGFVRMFDAIPAGTTYVPNSTTVNGGSVTDTLGGFRFAITGGYLINGTTQSWRSGVIVPNDSSTIKFRVRVSISCGQVENTATIYNGLLNLITQTNTLSVSAADPAVANAGADQYKCNNGSFTMAATVFPTLATGAWSIMGAANGAIVNSLTNGTSLVTGLNPGTSVTLRWTVTSVCSSSSDDVVLTNGTAPTIILGTMPSVCLGATSTTLPYGATTNNPDQYSIAFSAVALSVGFVDVTNATLSGSPITIAIPTGATAATYNATLTIRNSLTGCTSNQSISITINPAPLANAGSPVSVCSGSSVTIGTAALASHTYAWNPATALSATNVAQPTASPTVATTYTVTVTNTLTGCTNTSSVFVSMATPPTITLGASPSVCRGITSVNLPYSATTGTPTLYSINFSLTSEGQGFTDVVNATLNSGTITIAVPSGAAAGTYSATLTVINGLTGCPSVAQTIQVTVLPRPTASAGSAVTICSGSSTSIGAATVAGNSYAWNPAAGLSSASVSNPTANPTATTTYTVTVTNASGCTATSSVVVTVTTLTPANAGPDQSNCTGNTFTMNATAPPVGSGAWSVVSGTATITTPSSRTSAVTLTTASAILRWTVTSGTCQVTDDVEIIRGSATINPGLIMISQTGCGSFDPDIFTNNISATASSGTVTYQWASSTTSSIYTGFVSQWTNIPGATSSTYNPPFTTQTTYFVRLATVSGCAAATTVPSNVVWAVVQNSNITLTATPSGPICEGTNVTFNVTGTAPLLNLVTNGDFTQGLTGFGSDFSYDPNTNSTSAYCGSYKVGTLPTPIGEWGTSCPDDGHGRVLMVNGTGGAKFWKYNVSVLPNTTYRFQFQVAKLSANNSSNLRFYIGNNNIEQFSLSSSNACEWTTFTEDWFSGSNSGVVEISLENLNNNCNNDGNDFMLDNMVFRTVDLVDISTLSGTWNWTGPNSFTSTSQSPTITGITAAQAGVYTVNFSVGGCTGTASTTLSLRPNPIVTIGASGPTTFCSGGSVTLTATGGGTYAWSSGETTAAITKNAAGTYTVTVTNAGGCTGTASTTITILPTPTITLGANPSVCRGVTSAELTYSATTDSPNQYSIDFNATAESFGFADVTLASLSSSPIVITVPAGAPIGTYNAMLTVRNTLTGCSSIAQAIQVNVVARPTANAGVDQTLCTNLFTITGNTPSSDQSGIWTVKSGIAVIDAITNATTTVIVANGTRATLSWTISNGTCSASDDIILTSAAAVAGEDQSLCEPPSFTMTAVTPLVGTGTWTLLSGSATITSINSPTTTVTIPIGTRATLRWTVNTGVCSSFDDIILLNAQAFVANAGPDQSQCNNGNTMFTANSTSVVACVANAVVANGSFEAPYQAPNTFSIRSESSVPAWKTTAADDKIEFWGTGFNGVPAYQGNQFVELNANLTSALYQDLCVLPGDSINWSVAHRGRSGVDSMVIRIGVPGGLVTQKKVGTGNTAWVVYTGGYRVPLGQTVTRFQFEAVSTASGNNSVGNFIDDVNIDLISRNSIPGVWTVVSGTGTITSPNDPITGVTGVPAGGSVTLRWTLNNSVCSFSDDVVFTNNGLPTLTLGANPSVCIGSTSANLSYSAPLFSPNQYSINFDLTAEGQGFVDVVNATLGSSPIVITVPSGVVIGNYNATITVRNTITGCVGTTQNIQVIILPRPTANAGSAVSICSGNNTTIGSTSVAGNTYAWSPSTGLSSTSVSNPTANPIATTTYTVTVTNISGCTATSSVVVTVNPLATTSITSSGPTTFCSNSSVTLTATGSGTYAWSTGETIDNITKNVSGTYTVTITNASGCTATASQTVTVNPSPTASISGTATICNGGNTNLTATGGGTYAWSTGATTAAINVVPSITTTYTVTVTNASGCTATASQEVIVNPLPSVGISGTTSICNGGNTNLTATDGGTYAWNTGAATAFINVTPSVTTTYTVTVTNASGCTATASQTVTVNPLPTASISGTSIICNGGNTNLTAAGGTTYAWSTGATTAAINVNPSVNTTYTVTVTNANGCTATASRAVTVNPSPTVNISGTSTICNGNNTNLTATGGGTYSWSTGAITALINVTPSVTTTYTVTVTNSNGCTATASQTVTVNPTPTITLGSIAGVCRGTTSASLPYSATTSSPNVYLINFDLTAEGQGFSDVINAALPTGAISIAVPSGAAQGTYNATLVVRNSATGCPSVSQNIQIRIDGRPIATVTANPAQCNNGTFVLAGNAPPLGTGAWSVVSPASYNSSNISSLTLRTATASNVPAGTPVTLAWTVTNGVCSSSSTVVLTNDVLPIANAGLDANLCNATTFTLLPTAPSVGTGVWSVVSGSGAVSGGVLDLTQNVCNPATQPTGSLSREIYTGIGGGTAVANLTSAPTYPNNPNITNLIPQFSSNGYTGDSYGTRVRGYIRPTVTGNYTFIITGDDDIELYLSTDANPTNKTRIAYFNGWTNVTEYTKFPTQTSVTISLVAGQNYYTELLHKEGSGGDNFQVYWKTPSSSVNTIIPGANLVPFCTPQTTLRWTVTNGTCTATDDVIVINSQPVTANAGPDQINCGSTFTMAAALPALGTGVWTIVSGPGTITTPTSYNTTVTGVTLGSTTVLRWTVTNGACSSFDEVSITNRALTLTAGGNLTVCPGMFIQFFANVNDNVINNSGWNWSGPASFASLVQNPARPNATLAMGGTYTVNYNANRTGCPQVSTTATIVMSNVARATLTAKNTGPYCEGSTIVLDVDTTQTTPNGIWTWTLPNGTTMTGKSITIPNATTAMNGIYTVQYALSGCDFYSSTVVVVYPNPTASATNTGPFCYNTNINLFGSGVDPSACTNSTNLVFNGDFNITNAATRGFTSQYNYTSNAGWGNYFITNSPAVIWPSFARPCTDHTTGTGNMLIADGINIANSHVWQQNVTTVEPNKFYRFSVWVNNLYTVSFARIRLTINGQQVGTTLEMNYPVCQWVQVSGLWYSGNSTTADLRIYDDETSGAGNDYALDDIAFNCHTFPATASKWTWSGPNGYTSNLQSPVLVNATPINSGIYTLVHTSVNGCTAAATTTLVIVKPDEPVSFAGLDKDNCNNSTFVMTALDPTIVVDPNAGAGSGSWRKISGPGSISSLTDHTATVTGVPLDATTVFEWTVVRGTCIALDTVILRNFRPVTSNAGSNQTLCNTATFNIAATTPSVGTGVWSVVSGTGTVTSTNSVSTTATGVNPNTTTVLRWTVTNGACNASSDISLTNDGAVTSNAGVNQTQCDNGTFTLAGNTPSVGSGIWSIVGATNGATITTPTSATSTVTGLSAGSLITLRWTLTNGTCSSTDDVVLTNNPAPTPSISGTSIICNGGSTTLTAAGGGTYAWSTGATTAAITVSPKADATYTVTVTNSNGCTATATQAVTVNPLPTASISGTSIICNGSSTTLTATGGGTYLWSTGATTAAITVSPTANITYTVTVTNSSNCTATASQAVTVNPLPTASITGTAIICNGSSTTLTAVGSGTYAWSTGETTAAITVSPTANATYTVTVTNGSGCTATATRAVTVNPLPTASITGTSVICNGVSTILTAAGGGTYLWSTGATTAAITVSPTANATYTVTVTNASNCTSTAIQTVTVNPIPTPSISGISTICRGESTTLTAAGGSTYLWSTGATTADITVSPIANATYSVTVTNSNNCTAVATQAVTVNQPTTVNAYPNRLLCAGDVLPAINFTGSGTSYTWTNNNTAIGLAASGTGNISAFTVTNTGTTNIVSTITVTPVANGCNGTPMVFTITVKPLPTVPVTVNQVKCAGDLSDIITLSTSGVTYNWTNNNTSIGLGGSGSGTIASFTTVNAGATPVVSTITITPISNGCTGPSTQVTITVNPKPTASITGTATICNGNSTTLTAAGVGTYAWNTGETTAAITVSPTANATYTVTVTNGSGCTATASRGVAVNPLPTANITGTSVICNGGSTTLTATGGGTYLWSNGSTASFINVSPTADATYSVTVTNSNGCTATASRAVTVNPLPTASITGTSVICNGGSTTLTASGGGTYLWSTGATTAAITVSPTANITYTVTVTNASNCTATASQAVTVNPLPTASITGTAIICNGSSTTLTAVGSGTYAWSTGETTAAITVNPTADATYTVTVTNGSNCTATASQLVTVNANVTANANVDQAQCNNGAFTLAGNTPSVGSGLWTIVGATNGATIATPTSSTTGVSGLTAGNSVTLRWTVTNGACSSSDDVVLTNNANVTANANVDQAKCNNGSFTLAANIPTSPATGLWSIVGAANGATITTPTSATTGVTGLTAGSSVTLKWTVSNNTCSSNDDVVLTNNENVVATANVDQAQCNSGAFTLAANTPSVGSGIWTIVGAANGTTITTPTSETSGVTGLIAGSSVTLRWTVSNGTCSSSDDVVLRNNAPVTANAGLDQLKCVTGSFTLAGNVPTSPASGLWTIVGAANGATISSPTSATAGISGLTAGNSVTLNWTVTNGTCSSSDEVIMTNNANVTATAGAAQAKCSNGSFTLAANAVTSPVVGTWSVVSPVGFSTSNISNVNSNTATVSNVVVGAPVTLRWTVSNGACSSSSTVVLTNNPTPSVSAAPSAANYCSGTTITLNGTLISGNNTGATWSWAKPDGGAALTGQNPTRSNSTTAMAGVYTVTFTQANGCSATATTTVSVTQQPAVTNAGGNQTLCNTSTFNLNATAPAVGAGQWIWVRQAGASISDINDRNAIVTGVVAGDYAELIWRVTNGACFANSTNLVLRNLPRPTATINAPVTNACTGTSLTFSAGNVASGVTYAWTFGAGSSVATATGANPASVAFSSCASRNVRLIATLNGCNDTTYVLVNTNDTINPVFANRPINMTVECDAIPPMATNVTSSDNCGIVRTDAFETSTYACDTATYFNGLNAPAVTSYWNAEGRIGDVGAATYEMDLNRPSPFATIGATAQARWHNGIYKKFTYIYNPNAVGANKVTYVLDNDTTNLMLKMDPSNPASGTPFALDFDALRVTMSSSSATGTLAMDSVYLNGLKLDMPQPSVTGVSRNVLATGWKLNQGFVITGKVAMSWTGAIPTQSALNYNISVGKLATPCVADECKQQNYLISRTWVTEDGCKNTVTTTQVIKVQDTKAPVLTIPANVTLECGSIPLIPTVTAVDNCDATPTVTYNGEVTTQTTNGTCTDRNYTLTRTWTAVDNCGNTSTATQVITVIAAPLVDISASSDAICENGSVSLSSVLDCRTGTAQTYQWQQSDDATTWVNVASNGTSPNYSTSGLTETTHFRLLVLQGACTGYSDTVTISVSPAPSVSVAVDNATICQGGSVNLTATVTGGVGTVSYQWQESSNGSTGWTNISAATNNTYTTPALTATRYYRVVITQTGAGCTTTSTSTTVTVVNDPSVTTQPQGFTECTGGTLQLNVTATGGTPLLTYQWQQSANGSTGWTDIAAATGTSYTPNSVATGTFYYRVVVSATGVDCGTAYSNPATVVIAPDPEVQVTVPTTTVCTDGRVILTANPTGGTGTCTVQWQSKLDTSSTWNDVPGATGNTYQTNALNATSNYRAVMSCSGNGCCN